METLKLFDTVSVHIRGGHFRDKTKQRLHTTYNIRLLLCKGIKIIESKITNPILLCFRMMIYIPKEYVLSVIYKNLELSKEMNLMILKHYS